MRTGGGGVPKELLCVDAPRVGVQAHGDGGGACPLVVGVTAASRHLTLWLAQLAGELAAGRQWVERHVSDHSGAHHCYTVLRLWLRQDAPGAEAALVEHATAVRSLIITYPGRWPPCPWHTRRSLAPPRAGHEALWSHVRALLSLWLQLRAGRPAHCAGVTDETGAEELEAALRCSAAEGDESDTDSSGSVGSEVGPPACADAGRKATEYLRAEWELATRCLRDRMADDFATQRALAARHAAWVALQVRSRPACMRDVRLTRSARRAAGAWRRCQHAAMDCACAAQRGGRGWGAGQHTAQLVACDSGERGPVRRCECVV